MQYIAIKIAIVRFVILSDKCNKSNKKRQMPFKIDYMSFWNVVVDELEYQGKPRKWLASEAQFDVSTIGTGLKRNSMPQVDLALRIAKALNVPVEYLVTGKNQSSEKISEPEDLHKFHKYAKIIENLDALPDRERIPIINMIDAMKNAN